MSTSKYIVKWVGPQDTSGNYLSEFKDGWAQWHRLSSKAKRYSLRQVQRVASAWGPGPNYYGYVRVIEVSS